jgi:hypothetical protein
MKVYKSEQVIGQLEKRKGGYFFLKIEAEIVNKFRNKKLTRFLLTLGKKRNIIHQVNKIKDIDRQVQKTIKVIRDSSKPRPKKPS